MDGGRIWRRPVNEDVWSEQDTTPDAIEAAMRAMLRTRHAENEQLAPARVLNLVVVVDREWKGEISNRLERAGRYHGSRTILCSVEEGRTTLDAIATVSYDNPEDELGVMWEKVEIDLGPSICRRCRRSSTRSSSPRCRRCCGRPIATTRRYERCSA